MLELFYQLLYVLEIAGRLQDLKNAAEFLAAAKNPVIVAGGGVVIADSIQEVVKLAEQAIVQLFHNFLNTIGNDDPSSSHDDRIFGRGSQFSCICQILRSSSARRFLLWQELEYII